MKTQLRYNQIIVLIGLIIGGILFITYFWINSNLPGDKHSRDVISEARLRELREVLNESPVFRMYVQGNIERTIVAKRRLTEYFQNLKQPFKLKAIGLFSMQNGEKETHVFLSEKYTPAFNEWIDNVVSSDQIRSVDEMMIEHHLRDEISMILMLPKTNSNEQFFLAVITEAFPEGFIKHEVISALNSFILIIGGILIILIITLLIFNKLKSRRIVIAEFCSVLILLILYGFLAKAYVDAISKHEIENVFKSLLKNKVQFLGNNLNNILSDLSLIKALFESSEMVTEQEFVTYTSTLFDEKLYYEAFFLLGTQVSNKSSEGSILPILTSSKNSGNSFFSQRLIANHEFQKMIDQSLKTDLFYSKAISFLSDSSITQTFLVTIQPVTLPKDGKYSGKKHFAIAIVDPQRLLSSAMGDGNTMNVFIQTGLVFTDLNEQGAKRLMAFYPLKYFTQNLDEVHWSGLHASELSMEFPIVFGGNKFIVLAHPTPEFKEFMPALKGFFFIFFSVLIALLLATIIYLLRNKWFKLEEAVEVRTSQLFTRVKELELLRDLSNKLTECSTVSEALTWLCLRYNTDNQLSVNNYLLITYHGSQLCNGCRMPEDKHRTGTKYEILEGDKTVGFLELKWNETNHTIDQNNKAELFFFQLQSAINLWIAVTHARQQLNKTEEQLSKLVESSFDGIYMLQNNRFVWVNQAFADMLEYSLTELTSPDFYFDKLLTPKSKEIAEQRTAMQERGETPPPRFDFQHRSKSAKVIDVEISHVSIDYGNNVLFLGIVRDVTEQRLMERTLRESEERLQQQNEELQVMNEELTTSNAHMRELNLALSDAKKRAEAGDKIKTAFLNNISHEIRTPLNGICGASQMLSNPDLNMEEKHEMIEILNVSTRRLLRTITEYMDISLLESENMPVLLTDASFALLMQPIVDEFDFLCNKKGLKFSFNKNFNDVVFKTDRSLFEKVISHLLDNAVKFTEAGSVSVRSELVDDTLLVEVKDTGKGMEPHFQAKVFEVFVQEEYTNTRKFDGSGLGLPITKRIMDLLGGKISLESKKGQGSTFRVVFPLREIQNPMTTSVEKPGQQHPFPCILVAEDEDSNFLVLKLLMERRLKAKVFRATNGEQAVELVRTNKDLNLVLMDIKMPLMDGYEATRLIKSLRPQLPVIAITAYSLSGDELKANEAGCDDYIAKPVQAGIMFQKINKLTGF
jgi:PAS domain S-box-containing protein